MDHCQSDLDRGKLVTNRTDIHVPAIMILQGDDAHYITNIQPNNAASASMEATGHSQSLHRYKHLVSSLCKKLGFPSYRYSQLQRRGTVAVGKKYLSQVWNYFGSKKGLNEKPKNDEIPYICM